MEQELINTRDINWAIKKACVGNGCPQLADIIEASWSLNIVQSTGSYRLRDNTIRLSKKVMRFLPRERQLEAVIREACHLISWHLYHDTANDKNWEMCMARAGYTDISINNRVPTKTRRKPYTPKASPFFFSCGCDKLPYQINSKMAKCIVFDKQERFCPHCKQILKIQKNLYLEAC